MKTLDLYLTKICNLDCEYCYVDVVKKEDTQFPVKEFTQRINLLDYDDIKFFGGEPLVKWDMIQEIVLSVQNETIKPQFTIVTNGILLNEEKIEFITTYNISVIASIHEGSFGPLKKKIPLLQKLGNNIGFYIIFDPEKLSVALRNFLLFSQNGFVNFNFAPEIYSDWSKTNLQRLEKTLDILIPYIKKHKINISGIERNNLKILNRACEKTVYDEQGNFSPCNRFTFLRSKETFRYHEAYSSFDREIDFSHDPLRWFYICPVGWYLDHEGEKLGESIQNFKLLNRVFINFFRKIYDEHYSFLTENIAEIRFNLTQQCNLRCEYCYVDFKDEVLDEKIGKNIIDFFIEQEGNTKKISFFGGEPMLEFELMQRLVEYTEKKATTLGKRVKYSIATNFTLVTQKKVDFLKHHNFEIHISLNGDKVSNDALRDNSSKLVLKNIEKYFNSQELSNLCILFAFSPHNIDDIPKNLEFLISKGMRYFNLELIFGQKYLWKREHVEKAAIYFKTLQKKHPYISYANRKTEDIYIDINTDGSCNENSLTFHGNSIDSNAKRLFDTLL